MKTDLEKLSSFYGDEIVKIEKVDNDELLGYLITLSNGFISLMIDNESNCCESWGAMMTNDNLEDFIGASFLELTETTSDDISPPDEFTEKHTVFVDIKTSRGTLQFTAYNQHNGYYGHNVEIIVSKADKITYKKEIVL